MFRVAPLILTAVLCLVIGARGDDFHDLLDMGKSVLGIKNPLVDRAQASLEKELGISSGRIELSDDQWLGLCGGACFI